jgi:glycosyltransferase involved in cell wall biosynthesis
MWGLFVQRHALAVQGFADVSVISLHPDPELTHALEPVLSQYEGIREIRIYYRPCRRKLPLLGPLCTILIYLRAWRCGLRILRKSAGLPDISHVHVLTRMAVPAFWLRLRYGIPYLITEHWSRYLPAGSGFKGLLRRKLTRFLVSRASAVTTVTRNLAEAMQSHGLHHPAYSVVPNCVDTDSFRPGIPAVKPVRNFLHVSVFDDKSKNVSGLLRAVAQLASRRKDFHLTLVGEGHDLPACRALALELGIDEFCSFPGLQEGTELARSFAEADLLLLFSNYENIPVVINEAMASSLPVLATRVGGIPEYLEPRFGMMVEPRDEEGLCSAMISFLDGKLSFDKDAMRHRAMEEYSYDAVGRQFMELYTKALKR